VGDRLSDEAQDGEGENPLSVTGTTQRWVAPVRSGDFTAYQIVSMGARLRGGAWKVLAIPSSAPMRRNTLEILHRATTGQRGKPGVAESVYTVFRAWIA
jgi:hypothetical protein